MREILFRIAEGSLLLGMCAAGMRQGKVCRFPELHIFDSFKEFLKVVSDAENKHYEFLQKSNGKLKLENSSGQSLSSAQWDSAAAEQCKVASTLQAIAWEMGGNCDSMSGDFLAASVAQTAAVSKSYVPFVLPSLRLVAHPYTEHTLPSLLVGTRQCIILVISVRRWED